MLAIACTPAAGIFWQLDPPAASQSALSSSKHVLDWGLWLLQGRASSDHTTLLLNCYTKLKNLSKLDSFLKGDGSDDGTPLLNFDVDTAVKVGPGLNNVYMWYHGCQLIPAEGGLSGDGKVYLCRAGVEPLAIMSSHAEPLT